MKHLDFYCISILRKKCIQLKTGSFSCHIFLSVRSFITALWELVLVCYFVSAGVRVHGNRMCVCLAGRILVSQVMVYVTVAGLVRTNVKDYITGGCVRACCELCMYEWATYRIVASSGRW